MAIKLSQWLESTPSGRSVIVMSGGMDSAIAARLMVEKNGGENTHALSFYYGQKQSIELDLAQENSKRMGIAKHTLVDISFLGDMVRGMSANIKGGVAMPTIHDILGDPAPPTEVPFRNGILFMIAAAYAQANNLETIVTGVQASDQYSYFDTTPAFVDAMNGVLAQNRMHDIQIYAPWQGVSKCQEIEALIQMDGDTDLLNNTLTCYNPEGKVSCGKCPSCSERIQNFIKAGVIDGIPYAIDIPWQDLINKAK